MPTTICKTIMTETAHRLPDHKGRCFFFHGHSYKWEVRLTTEEVRFDGMVMDFSELKQAMTEIIDQFDHCLVVYEGDPHADLLPVYRGKESRTMVVPYIPTAENMAFHVWLQFKEDPTFAGMGVAVRLWETTTSWAEYAEP